MVTVLPSSSLLPPPSSPRSFFDPFRHPLLPSFSPIPSPTELHLRGAGFITPDRPRTFSPSPIFAKPGSRSALYGNCEDYVLIEPGQDETFVNLEELRIRLKGWLENWPGQSLPDDLAAFSDLDAAVTYLVDSACELEICDGSGVVQWFEVRL